MRGRVERTREEEREEGESWEFRGVERSTEVERRKEEERGWEEERGDRS